MAQPDSALRARRRRRRAPWIAACLLAAPLAHGADVNIEVRGVDDELRDNVLAYLSFAALQEGRAELTSDTVERLHNRVDREVQAALRPFGYYDPKVDSTVSDQGHGDWRVVIDITPGPPVLVQHIDVHVDGPGETDPLFQRILHHLPLHPGDRLNHATTRQLKADLQRTAATYGYLDAKHDSQRAGGRPGAAHRQRRPRARHRRALPLRRHHHPAARGQRQAGAPLPALSRRAIPTT